MVSARRRLLIVAFSAGALIVFATYRVNGTLAYVSPTPPLSPSDDNRRDYDPTRFHKRLSETEKQYLLDGNFVIVDKTEAMPATVKQAFAVITTEGRFALANPGEKFQVTDVISEPGQPRRRLVFAGVKDDQWFIHYERGGRSHSYYVLVFKIDPQNRLHFVWGGAGFGAAKQLEELRAMIAAGQFSDQLPFFW